MGSGQSLNRVAPITSNGSNRFEDEQHVEENHDEESREQEAPQSPSQHNHQRQHQTNNPPVPVVGAASSCMAKSYRVVVGALVGGEDNFDHFKVPKSLRDVIEAAAAALANVQCGESLNKSCMDLSTALKSLLSAFHDVAKQASSLAKSLPDAAKALLLSPNLKIKGLKAAAHGFATTLKLGSRFIAPLVHLTNNKEKLMETWEAMKTLAAPLEELVNNHPELQDQVEAIREDLVETEGNVEQIVQGVLDSATSALNDDCIPFLKMVDQWLLDLSYLKPSKALKAAVAAGGVTVSEVMRTAASQDRLDPAQADDNLKELSEAAIESLRSACLQIAMKLLSSTVVPKSAANLCALVLKPVADLDSFSDSVTSAFDKIKADADVLSDDVEEIGKTAMADLQQDLRSEKGAEEISDMAVSLFERIFSRFDGKSTAHLETTLSDFNYKRDKACRVLSKYSFLLKGAVQGAAMAAGALPFGGHIIAAAIGGFYAHAEGAAKNDRNCLNLYRLVRFVERQLHHLQGMEEKYAKDEDVKSSVKDLLVSIHEASKVVRRFVGRKFVLKMLLSSSDDAKFTRLDASINKSIAAISFVVSMQLSVRDEPAYISADSQELKAAIMDEAGLTAEERSAPDCMQIAIAKLSSTPEGKKKLKDLIREHRKETLSITEDHLMREIDGIQAQLKEFRDLAVHIEHQMDFIGASVHMLLLIASERSASSSLSVFLADWWKKAFKFKRSTRDGTKALPWKDFCNILLDGNGVAEGVAIIDRELRALMTAENIDVEEVSSIVSVNCGKEGISIVSIFLSCVLRPLLLHSEATVSQSSLVRLMAIVDEWCQKEKAGDISQAKDWDSFLALIFRVSPLSMLKPVLVKKHLSVMLPSPLPRRRTMPRSQTRAKAISSSQAQAIRVQPTHLIESEPSHSSVAKCDLFSEAVASAVDDLRRSNEEIIESYHISDVLAEYVKGTRQWLLNELMSWMNEETASSDAALDRKSALAVKESEGADKEEATGAVDLMGRHLMFVLVASPGMGKSVFSALVHTKLTAQEFYHQEEGGEGSEEIKRTIVVSHFFKAGQKRAQGLSMIISLASQLADKLGGAMASSFSASIGSRAEFQVVKKELDDLNKAKKDLEAVLSNVKEKTKANITAMTRQLEERARRVVNEGALEKDIYESEQTKVKLEREEAELGSRLKEVEMRLAELLEVLKANPWIDLEDLENAADIFLIQPLAKVAESHPSTSIVVLLDALDEAAHIKQDCTPVIHLISKTFRLLPPQVKFILTSRLEQANKLKDWSPRVIEPTAQSNMTDVSILIKAKVKASDLNATGRINPLHHDQAVKLMVERSKGQIVYTKYVFDYLKLRETWTIQDLRALLPYGLSGAYELLMRIIDETLRNERPRLQELLKDRLLAILTLAPEPLTLSQIVFACNQVQPPAEFWPSKHRHMPSCYDNPSWKQASRPRFSKDDLECLLQLLYNLFPPRGLSIDEQPQPLFVPYHKSVADWFKCEAGMNSGEYQVDKRWGERLLREAGFSLGESPLIIAAKKGKDGALEVLLRAGCNPNVKDEGRRSPLWWAVEMEKEAMATLLVDAGADFDAKADSGRTPAMLAAMKGNESIVRLLEEAGADMTLVDNDGNTASDLLDQAKKSSWMPINRRGSDGMITSHELGRAPLPSRPPWLSSRGLGQRNILDSPLAWSIQASDCIKLFDDFMVTETWSALADAFGGEEKITTADLVHYFVKPLTRATGSSLALLLNKDMETPHVAEGIVSHAWYGSAVETYLCLKTINLSAYVYFDPFTMYHNGEDHPNALSVSAQVQATPMEKIAASQPKYGMYLIHTSLYDVYERLWIIYELDVARVAGIVIRGLYDLDSFLKVDGLKKLTEKRVDVRAAKVVNGADRDLIERSINTHGGYDALHECIERVRRVMNECLLPKAAYVGHWTLVKAFVLEECDLDAKDYDGSTALIWAVRRGHMDIFELLVDSGADKESRDNENGWTALMWAAAFGRVNCITILIEAGADKEAKSRPRPDSPSTYSWTALMVAVDNGHNEGVEALLDQGAIARLDGYPNIEAKDEDGCTPLARAARNGWSRTVRLLLDSGADVNAMSKNGNTPLILASREDHVACVQLLVDAGASRMGGGVSNNRLNRRREVNTVM